MDTVIVLTAAEASGFSEACGVLINDSLQTRREQVLCFIVRLTPFQLWKEINEGQVEMNKLVSINHEHILQKACMNIAIQANNEQLPVFHPNYHDAASSRMKLKSTLALLQAKQDRHKS